jgi:hypothetical protein
MGWTGKAAGAALCAALGLAAPATAMSRQGGDVDFGKQQAAAEVRDLARWTMRTADHAGLPFAIVDKKNAHIYVFDGGGRLRGASPVLLGQAIGDESAPDVGEHAQTGNVPLEERTTPAGRFVSEPGRNRHGEQVVWVDYQSAFAIHRLRPGPSRRPRQLRLASATPHDNRASYGCVVVPVRFYLDVVARLLGQGRGVVYVLPEQGLPRNGLDAL